MSLHLCCACTCVYMHMHAQQIHGGQRTIWGSQVSSSCGFLGNGVQVIRLVSLYWQSHLASPRDIVLKLEVISSEQRLGGGGGPSEKSENALWVRASGLRSLADFQNRHRKREEEAREMAQLWPQLADTPDGLTSVPRVYMVEKNQCTLVFWLSQGSIPPISLTSL